MVVEGPAKTKQGSKPPPTSPPPPPCALSDTAALFDSLCHNGVAAARQRHGLLKRHCQPCTDLEVELLEYLYIQTNIHAYLHTYIHYIYIHDTNIYIYIYIYYKNTLSSISSATTGSAPAHSSLVPGAALPGLRRPCVRAARKRRRRRSGGGGINFFS